MMDWIFKRPPYASRVELPNQAERFEVRVTIRMDHSLYAEPERADRIATELSEAIRELEERMQRAFNSELFDAADHPFLIDTADGADGTPYVSETTREGMIITNGVDFKRKGRGR